MTMHGFALAGSLGLLSPVDKPDVRVLLVGLGPYSTTKLELGDLAGVTDCRTMRQTIKALFGGKVSDANFRQIPDPGVPGDRATKARIEGAFKEWLVEGAKPNDTLIFYFSGHGTVVLDSNNRVVSAQIPIDGARLPNSRSFDASTLVTREFFNGQLARLDPKTNVTLVFDSCHSGAAARGNAVAKGADNPGVSASTVAPDVDLDRLSFKNAVMIGAAKLGRKAWQNDPEGGNLTVALCRAVRDRLDSKVSSGPLTYRELKDRTLAHVASLGGGDTQEPVFALDPAVQDREVFGNRVTVSDPYFAVNVDSDGVPTMAAGSIYGLQKGCTVAIYPSGATKMQGTPLATATIEVAEPFHSRLKLTRPPRSLTSLQGARARVTDMTPDARIYLDLAEVPATVAFRSALEELLKETPLVTTTKGSGATVHVSAPAPGGSTRFPSDPKSWVVSNGAGRELGRIVSGAPADDIARAVQTFALNEGRRVALMNLRSSNPWVKVDFEVASVDTKPLGGGAFEVTKIHDAANTRSVGPDDFVALRIRAVKADGTVERSTEDQMEGAPFIAILNILANGTVKASFPSPKLGEMTSSGNRQLPVDGKWHYVALHNQFATEAQLSAIVPWRFSPDLDGEGVEVFKLLATDQEVNIEPFVSSTRGENDPNDESPLGRILSAFKFGQPVSRDDSEASSPTRYAVDQVTLNVHK